MHMEIPDTHGKDEMHTVLSRMLTLKTIKGHLKR